ALGRLPQRGAGRDGPAPGPRRTAGGTPPDGRDRSGISPHTIRHFPDRRRARLPPSFRPRTPTPGKEEHDAGCVRTRPAPARHAGDRRRYGLLFALGWLVLYFGVYLPRGGVQP